MELTTSNLILHYYQQRTPTQGAGCRTITYTLTYSLINSLLKITFTLLPLCHRSHSTTHQVKVVCQGHRSRSQVKFKSQDRGLPPLWTIPTSSYSHTPRLLGIDTICQINEHCEHRYFYIHGIYPHGYDVNSHAYWEAP